MSANTWNFACWQDRDAGASHATLNRGEGGGTFETFNATAQTPFSSEMSGVFSFFLRSDYTALYSDFSGFTDQWLYSLGYPITSNPAFEVRVRNDPSGTGNVRFRFYDNSASTLRWDYQLGDEDGSSPLQLDKWYQVAFSASSSAFLYAVNGSTTPKIIGTPTTTGGALNINYSDDRWWFSRGANLNLVSAETNTDGFSSMVRGPAAFAASTLDLSDSSVRGRIFDTDGNLKSPGVNGSLWFNDTYTTTAGYKPDFYFPHGVPRATQGSDSNVVFVSDFQVTSSAPGALRKMYE